MIYPANDLASYQAGDYVWAKRNGERQLARIASPHPSSTTYGKLWSVTLRGRHHWSSDPTPMLVEGPLSPIELERNRRSGLIPTDGVHR